jgi:hypothetical protein
MRSHSAQLVAGPGGSHPPFPQHYIRRDRAIAPLPSGEPRTLSPEVYPEEGLRYAEEDDEEDEDNYAYWYAEYVGLRGKHEVLTAHLKKLWDTDANFCRAVLCMEDDGVVTFEQFIEAYVERK